MHNHKEDLAKIGKPVDRTEWGMSPPTVNAYYNPTNNEIVFPPEFFNSLSLMPVPMMPLIMAP